MPRSLVAGVARPACSKPDHARGRVWLFGYYGRSGYHQRPRFLCVPPRTRKGEEPAWVKHAFVERLPRRQASAEHPLGQACQSCWHLPSQDEGPQTGRHFRLTVREAALTLVRVGEGLTLRSSSYKAREHAWPSADPRLPADVSDHAQLAMNYLDAFGDEIYSRYAETEWPEAVILDASPQREKDIKESGAKKQGGKRVFAILGAYGYPNGLTGGGKLWRLAVHGAEDQVEWERFLTSMRGQPRWVVCDGSSAIANAVRAVWKGTVIYNCEWHIAHSGEEKLRPVELGGRYSDLVRLVRRSVMGPAEWSELEMAVAQLPAAPRRLDRWMRTQRRALPRLWSRRVEDMPCGAGPLEQAFEEINRSFRHRRFRFRNLGRLERVLAMMLLAHNKVADERRFAEIISDYLDRQPVSESVGRWRNLADPKGTGSSVRELAKQAAQRIAQEKALTAQRQAHERAARAWAKGQPILA
jgi:hypothetical protein